MRNRVILGWSLLILLGLSIFVMAQTRPEELWPYAQGTGEVSNATLSAVVVTSPGAGLFNHIEEVVVACSTAAVGSGGIVRLRHAGVVIWEADADAVGVYPFGFGLRGHRSGTANTSLDIEVGGAATTQATCIATGISHVTR